MDIIMPKMGESVNEGTIIKWHKKVGDLVKLDEIIFEISTDKVDTEIPSSTAGVLSEILVKEGDTVEVGTVVARIQSDNISVPEPVISKESTTEKSVQIDVNKISPSDQKDTDTNANSEAPSKENIQGNVIEIAMPKMGESVMEGTIIKWNKKVGDAVKKDEMIFEISTDKVDTEIPSPESGTLAEILVGEQETVEVGTIVAKLAVSGSAAVSDYSEKERKIIEPVREEISMHDNFSKNIDTRPKEQGTGSGFYSPLVLSIAQKENVV